MLNQEQLLIIISKYQEETYFKLMNFSYNTNQIMVLFKIKYITVNLLGIFNKEKK